MPISPLTSEKKALEEIWRSQACSDCDFVDFTRKYFPLDLIEDSEGKVSKQELISLFKEILGWPKWVNLYAKPSLALLGAAKYAKIMARPKGILWMAPGTGKHFDPPKDKPGIAVLRVDWAKSRQEVEACVDEAREKDLLLVVDESNTGFRLAKGGACEYYEISPDMVIYGPSLASGKDFAVLAGKELDLASSAKQPDQSTIKTAYHMLKKVSDENFSKELEKLGRILCLGLEFFVQKTGLFNEVGWEGPLAMPRLHGKRIWAFLELAKEEGLNLNSTVMLDASLDLDNAIKCLWPCLARACARLKFLPQGAKAPAGWPEALANIKQRNGNYPEKEREK